MGSLCNFRPMRHPHSLKPSTIHTNNRVLYAFNRPNTNARLTRTRNHIPCLVVAQKNNNNGRNPEKGQLGSSKNSFNSGSNGILPKQETVAHRERGNKYQKPNVLSEYFSLGLQLWELFVSICSWILETMKSSIKIEFNRSNLAYMGLGLIYALIKTIFIFPFFFLWDMFWVVLGHGLKIAAVVAIIGYSYAYLF